MKIILIIGQYFHDDEWLTWGSINTEPSPELLLMKILDKYKYLNAKVKKIGYNLYEFINCYGNSFNFRLKNCSYGEASDENVDINWISIGEEITIEKLVPINWKLQLLD